jgi:hypothetical protein
MKQKPNFKVFVREYCKEHGILLSQVILDRTLAKSIHKIYKTTYGIKVKEIA